MRDNNVPPDETPLVSNRTMDIIVALLFLAASAIVIFDSLRIGVGWQEGQGPAPGSFPFYVAVIMGLASLFNLVRAVIKADNSWSEAFVSVPAIVRVMTVLVPTIAYVALIGYLGIYVASAIFLAGYMLYFGRENPIKAAAVGAGVALALFLMFEKWFLVPLPKGPLETWLGF
jgi:putative tricarboxylic transport membrane protein